LSSKSVIKIKRARVAQQIVIQLKLYSFTGDFLDAENKPVIKILNSGRFIKTTSKN
jgi:hypothetical protein